ncbi:MAG: hypothetical protein RLZZ299_1073 [Pseudomonadota bacterium]
MVVPTRDGAVVALHRHPVPGGPPVILVHGISSNGRFWDLDPDLSLAAWLQARGWDAWVLDLRGHGHAAEAAPAPLAYDWTVDTYGREDAPAAVEHVRRATGWSSVAWVGHSMGGMVGAVYLASGGDTAVSAFVPVASPAAFAKDDPLMGVGRAALAAGALLPRIDSVRAARMTIALGDPTGFRARLYNAENVPDTWLPRVMGRIVSPLGRMEMRHFARMIASERFVSYDGTVDWGARLRGVSVPTLAFAGGADQVVPAARASAWSDLLGGSVEVVAADRAHGVQADYGHLDFGVGVRAPEEIWPHIARFLTEHPPRRAP